MRYVASLLLLCLGCAAKEAETNVVPIADVAPDLLATARKTLPNVVFKSALKTEAAGEEAYEIRGTMPNGKVREVVVSVSGKVIEIE